MTPPQLRKLQVVSNEYDGEQPTPAMVEATNDFLRAASSDLTLFTKAADLLAESSPLAAAWIAVTVGGHVDRGGSARSTSPAILSLLAEWAQVLTRDLSESESAAPSSKAYQEVVLAFPDVARSAVSHLAKLPEVRAKLRSDSQFIENLEFVVTLSHGATWLLEAFHRSSGDVLVLHVPSERAFRLKYNNISNCFLLFTMLQDALRSELPGGLPHNRTASSYARGEGVETEGDQAQWHFGDPRSPTSELTASIWGEQLAADIPEVDGIQTILLWPPLLQLRSWDAGFLGPHLDALPASMTLASELSPDDVDQLMRKLGIAPTRKPWWRFW